MRRHAEYSPSRDNFCRYRKRDRRPQEMRSSNFTVRGTPLSSYELGKISSEGEKLPFVTPRDIARYQERHAGIREPQGDRPTPPQDEECTFEGLDFTDLNLPGEKQNDLVTTQSIKDEKVAPLLRQTFPLLTRLRQPKLTEDGKVVEGEEQPTGTEKLIYIDRKTLEEAAEVIKIPIIQPDTEDEARMAELCQLFYYNLAPDYFRPIQGFWIEDPLREHGTEKIYGYKMPKIERHPEFDEAQRESLLGRTEHLERLITNPFSNVYALCQENELPFAIDPPQRNFIITPEGTEVSIETPWVEPQDLTAALTGFNVFRAIYKHPPLYARRNAINQTLRELERLTLKQQQKNFNK